MPVFLCACRINRARGSANMHMTRLAHSAAGLIMVREYAYTTRLAAQGGFSNHDKLNKRARVFLCACRINPAGSANMNMTGPAINKRARVFLCACRINRARGPRICTCAYAQETELISICTAPRIKKNTRAFAQARASCFRYAHAPHVQVTCGRTGG